MLLRHFATNASDNDVCIHTDQYTNNIETSDDYCHTFVSFFFVSAVAMLINNDLKALALQ